MAANLQQWTGVILSFSTDGQKLATLGGSRYGAHVVRLWNVASGKLEAEMSVEGYTREFFSNAMFDIEHIAFSPDGKILMASSRKMVKLMDVKNGKEIEALEGAREPATFSPNGRTLVTTGTDKQSLQLWEIVPR